jgi:hypothetical protein
MTRTRFKIWRWKARKALREFAHGVLVRAKHPRRATCLDCGFLALGDAEVTAADRVMLAARGTSGCPSLDILRCSRSLWVGYDLTYVGTSAEGIFEELEADRRDCAGFLSYRPGWTPNEHRDLLTKALETREKALLAVLSFLLGVLTVLAVKLFGK